MLAKLNTFDDMEYDMLRKHQKINTDEVQKHMMLKMRLCYAPTGGMCGFARGAGGISWPSRIAVDTLQRASRKDMVCTPGNALITPL